MLRTASDSDADVIVFDLEDAVAPGRKDEGRTAVRELLGDPEFDPDAEVCVRVNGGRGRIRADLETVLDFDRSDYPDSVMLPKVDAADDVRQLEFELAQNDADDLPAIALLETARGVLHAEGIADADLTDALAFGAEDLAADLGATRTDEGTEVLHAREHVVLAAAAAGIDAIDTVFTDIGDTDGLREEAGFAKDLGYDGKMAIHPAQVDPINEAYTPDEDELEWARTVLEARDEADDRGVFRVDDEMIDAPLIAQAEQVIGRARAAGLVEPSTATELLGEDSG
jgi:citrate lyase subunit beta/citryl-CoA lyase